MPASLQWYIQDLGREFFRECGYQSLPVGSRGEAMVGCLGNKVPRCRLPFMNYRPTSLMYSEWRQMTIVRTVQWGSWVHPSEPPLLLLLFIWVICFRFIHIRFGHWLTWCTLNIHLHLQIFIFNFYEHNEHCVLQCLVMAATICHWYGDFLIYTTSAEAEWIRGKYLANIFFLLQMYVQQLFCFYVQEFFRYIYHWLFLCLIIFLCFYCVLLYNIYYK